MNHCKAILWPTYLLATILGVCGNAVASSTNKNEALEIYKWEAVYLDDKSYAPNSWQEKVIELFELQKDYDKRNNYESF